MTSITRSRRGLTISLALAAALAGATAAARAQTTGIWDTASGEWTNPVNWTSNPLFPSQPDDFAYFESPSAITVTVASPVSVGGILVDLNSVVFSSTTGASITLSSTTGATEILATGSVAGNGVTFSLPVNLASNLTITDDSSPPMVFSAAFTGTGNLTLNGNGTVNLRGTSSAWSPTAIVVASGVLSTASGSLFSLGNPNSGLVTVDGGASLDTSGLTFSTASQFTKTLLLSGAGNTASPGALAFGATNTTLLGTELLNGPTTFYGKSSGAVLNIGYSTGAASGATLLGTGPFIKSGTGIAQINIPASFTGGTQVNGGTLTVSPFGSLVGTGQVTVNAGGKLLIQEPAGVNPAADSVAPNTIALNGGTLGIGADMSLGNLFAPGPVIGALSIDTANFTAGGSNVVDLTTLPAGSFLWLTASGTLPATLKLIPNASDTLFFTGNFTDSTAVADVNGVPTNVEFGGTGLITVNGTSSYTGTTRIDGPTVTITSPTALGSSTGSTQVNSGTLNLNASTSETITLVGGAMAINSGAAGGNGAVTVAGGSLTLAGSWSNAILMTGGSLAVTANVATPITLNGGYAFLNVNTNVPVTLNSGTVTVSATSLGKIVVDGGMLRQTGTANFSSQSIWLEGGVFSYGANIRLVNFNVGSTGGVISIDSPTPFTNIIPFGSLSAGPNLSLSSATQGVVSGAITPDTQTQTIRFGGGTPSGTLTVNSVLADANGTLTNVAVNGPATIIFGTANTYSGTTTVNGLLEINNPLALGSGSGSDSDSTILNPGGTLVTGPSVVIATEKISMNGGQLIGSSNGPIAANGSANYLAGVFGGPLSGSGTVIFDGNSTLTGAGTFLGTALVSSGTLTLDQPQALGSSSSETTVQSATILLNATTLEPITLINASLLVGNLATASPGPITSTNSTLGGTGTLSGLVTLNGGITNVGGSVNLTGASAGTGTITLATGNVNFLPGHVGELVAPGSTTILSNSSSGTVAATTLTSGFVTFNRAPTFSSVSVNGFFYLNQATTMGTLTLDSGAATFGAPVDIKNLNMVANIATLNQGGELGLVTFGNGNLIVNGPTTFDDPLAASTGTVDINAQTIFSQGVVANGVNITFSVTNANNGQWQINTGNLQFNANNTISTLSPILGNAALMVATGSTLTLPSVAFGSYGGTLSGEIVGPTSITKYGNGTLQINVTDPSFHTPIYIDGGGVGFGSTVASPIFLSGRGSNTGLFGPEVATFISSPLGTPLVGVDGFTGTLNLGASGGAITGSGNVQGDFFGTIQGPGSLTIEGSFFFYPSSTYTGPTSIAGSILLSDRHTFFSSTSGIYLQPGGVLWLGTPGGGVDDQIADNVPVYGLGGTLIMNAGGASTAGYETIGAMSLISGLTTLETTGSGSVIGIGTLTRLPGAMLNVEPPGETISGVVIGNAPPLHNGMLPAWIVSMPDEPFSGTSTPPSFTTYTGAQVVPVSTVPDINAALPTDNVGLSANATLAASATVNSIQVVAVALDLGGNTLTLDSGGAIVFPGPKVSNFQQGPNGSIQDGALIPGADSNGELVIFGDGTVSANIVDGPSGPTSLTVYSYVGMTLNGTANTYTGPTHILGGQVNIALAPTNALRDFYVDAGGILQFISPGTAVIGQLTTDTNAVINASTINASSYLIQGLGLQSNVAFVGAGPMTIMGTFSFSVDSNPGLFAQYQGNITIGAGGILDIHNNSKAPTFSLGTGSLTLNNGGTLELETDVVANPTLNNAVITEGTSASTIQPSPTGTPILTGTVTVQGSSLIDRVSVVGPITLVPSSQLALQFAQVNGVSGAGSVTISQFTPVTSDGINASSLNVEGVLQIRANGTPTGTSEVGNLALIDDPVNGFQSQLDITDNKFILQSTDPADKAAKIAFLQLAVQSGNNGGTWTGEGITSSTVASDAATQTAHTYHTTLAIADNGALQTPFTTFGGLPVDSNSILMTRALVGDGNLDNTVNNADLVILLTHYGLTGQTQSGGDYTGDGSVNNADLVALLTDYGQSLPGSFSIQPAGSAQAAGASSPASPVPEARRAGNPSRGRPLAAAPPKEHHRPISPVSLHIRKRSHIPSDS